MPAAITNITELRAEISRLRLQKNLQESELRQYFNSPKAVWNTVTSLFRRPSQHTGADAAAPLDIWARLSKALLPLALDKTLFRKSNFIVRALAGMISQNVAKHIDIKSVTGLWEKLKGILPGVGPEKSTIDQKRDMDAKGLN